MVRGLIVLVLLFPTLARGAERASELRLTLREAVGRALDGNDGMRAGRYGVAASEEQVGAARSRLLPTVSLEERFLRTDTPAYVFSTAINQGRFSAADLAGAPESFNHPDAVNDFQTTLSIEQPIFVRRAFLGVDVAREEAGAARQDLERKREEIAFETYRAFVGAVTAEAFLETARTGLDNARAHRELARTLEEAGVGLASDRLRAEVAVGEAERHLVRARNDVEIARRALGLLLGLDEPVTPVETDEAPPEPVVEDLLALLPERADIRAMARRAANADRQVQLAESEFIPDLGFFGALQANDPDLPFGTEGSSYRVGAALTWNLFSGFGSSARRAAARAERERAEHLLRGMRRQARFEIRQAALRLDEARASESIARRALRAAEESLRLVSVRYENGLATIVALLDAQAALDRARADVVRTRMDERLARGTLLYRAGALLSELAPAAGAEPGNAPPDDRAISTDKGEEG